MAVSKREEALDHLALEQHRRGNAREGVQFEGSLEDVSSDVLVRTDLAPLLVAEPGVDDADALVEQRELCTELPGQKPIVVVEELDVLTARESGALASRGLCAAVLVLCHVGHVQFAGDGFGVGLAGSVDDDHLAGGRLLRSRALDGRPQALVAEVGRYDDRDVAVGTRVRRERATNHRTLVSRAAAVGSRGTGPIGVRSVAVVAAAERIGRNRPTVDATVSVILRRPPRRRKVSDPVCDGREGEPTAAGHGDASARKLLAAPLNGRSVSVPTVIENG